MDVFDIFTLYIYLTYVLIFQFCRATPVLLAATALVYRTDEIIQVTFSHKILIQATFSHKILIQVTFSNKKYKKKYNLFSIQALEP